MKTMRLKKLLLVLMTLFVSMTAGAVDYPIVGTFTYGGTAKYTWTLEADGTLTLAGNAGQDGKVTYYETDEPSDISGHPFYAYKDVIKKVIVANGITKLNLSIFKDFPIETLDLSEGGSLTNESLVERLLNNTTLKTICLGDKITTISNGMFRGCTALEKVVESTSKDYLSKITSIGNRAFSSCTSLKSMLIMGASALSIGYAAFENCTSLESFGAYSIGEIGNAAFMGCSALETFSQVSGPTSIGSQAFRYCTSLVSYSSGSGLTSVSTYPFDGCTSLKYLSLSASSLTGTFYRTTWGTIPDAAIVYLPAGCTVDEYNMVTGETCPDFRLYEGSEYKGIKSFTANKVTYERTMAADKLYTICLPYVYKNAAWKYYQIDKVADNTITFKEIDQESLAADEPYLVSTGTAGVSNLNTTVATAISGGYGVTKAGDFEFRGTFKEISNEYLTGETKNFYILQTDKSWKKVTTTDKTAYVPPFRGYIGTNKAVGARELMIDFEDDVTGVKQIKTVGLDGTEQYYDLSGRRLSQPKKGINIVNGRKVIIK